MEVGEAEGRGQKMFDSLFDDRTRRDKLHSSVKPTISFPASATRLIELTRDGRSKTGLNRVRGREQGGLSWSSEELFLRPKKFETCFSQVSKRFSSCHVVG